MFVEFSAGYYLGRCYIVPRDGDRAVMQTDDYEEACNTYYSGDGPLVMKLEDVHIPVHGADDLPSGSLGLPPHILERTRIRHPPEMKEVLLTKEAFAENTPVV